MTDQRPLTILCVSSYEKRSGIPAHLQVDRLPRASANCRKLRDGDWPRESLDELFFMPEDIAQHHLIYTVSYMNRSQPIDRIVALDDLTWRMSPRSASTSASRHGSHHHPLFPRQIGHACARARGWHPRPRFVPSSTTPPFVNLWPAFLRRGSSKPRSQASGIGNEENPQAR